MFRVIHDVHVRIYYQFVFHFIGSKSPLQKYGFYYHFTFEDERMLSKDSNFFVEWNLKILIILNLNSSVCIGQK